MVPIALELFYLLLGCLTPLYMTFKGIYLVHHCVPSFSFEKDECVVNACEKNKKNIGKKKK